MSDEAWLSDYLLGEGSAEDRAMAERRLEADPLLAERARELRQVTELLGAVPDEAWDDLDDTPVAPASELPHATGATPVAGRRPRRRRSLIAVAAAVILFAAGLATGAAGWSHAGSSARPSAEVTLRPLTAAGRARGYATVTAGGRMRLTVAGLPASGRGRFYEAWLMTSTTRLVPLASFRVTGGQATVQLALPAKLTAYRYVDVSLQRASAGTAISGRSVLRGRTTP